MEKDLDTNELLVETEDTQNIAKKKKKLIISIKTAVIVAVIIVLGALVFQYRSLFVVASIDGSFISRMEVVEELEKLSGKTVLDAIVTEKLIDNKANSMGIIVDAGEVDAEIKDIESQIIGQGSTLETVLLSQGLTIESLKKQIAIQKKLEKILADKIVVSDEEINQYIENDGVDVPAEKEAEYREFVVTQLKQQKLNSEAVALIDSLRLVAKIKYFKEY